MSYYIVVEHLTWIVLCHYRGYYRGYLHSLRGGLFSLSTHALWYMRGPWKGIELVMVLLETIKPRALHAALSASQTL